MTNSSSIVPESNFMYNKTRQELPSRNTYFTDSDEMRLRVTGYFQGEYMYMLSKDGLIINDKEYVENKQKTVTAS